MAVGSGGRRSRVGQREDPGPRVALVTTAAPADGGGNLARAMTLARELVRHDVGVTVSLLRGSVTAGQQAGLAELGVELVAGGAAAAAADAVVIDLPDPDEGAALADAHRLVVFDDSDRLRAGAAVVVQPSQPEWRGGAAVGRVLAGYRWAPIRSSILAARQRRGASSGRGVVVCFGGSDPSDVSARVVPTIAAALRGAGQRWGSRDERLTVIVGAGYRGVLDGDPQWTLLRDPADIDERLAEARVAVIGAGTMKFELAALGVPTVTLAVADDQGATGPPFARTGASVYAGDGRVIDPEAAAQTLLRLLEDEVALRAMRDAGRHAVDGRGAERLVAEILELIATG